MLWASPPFFLLPLLCILSEGWTLQIQVINNYLVRSLLQLLQILKRKPSRAFLCSVICWPYCMFMACLVFVSCLCPGSYLFPFSDACLWVWFWTELCVFSCLALGCLSPLMSHIVCSMVKLVISCAVLKAWSKRWQRKNSCEGKQ